MDLFRKVLWSNSHLCCLEISSSVHRPMATAQSTQKHFTDTPAVQFSRIWISNMNQQRWHYLAETARPQPWLKSAGGTNKNARRSSQLCLSQASKDQRRNETHKHCTASCTSKPSSASVTVHRVLFIPPPNITCPPCVLPQHVCLSQLTSLCQSA